MHIEIELWGKNWLFRTFGAGSRFHLVTRFLRDFSDVQTTASGVVPSAHRLARLFIQQQEQLDEYGQRLVKGLCQETKLERAYGLAQGFRRLVQGTSAVSTLEQAEAAIKAYERRFTIEESFKDAKTHWHLEKRRFTQADRFDRYLGVLSLIQGQLCQAALWLWAEVPEVGKRLGESGRNKLSLQNRLRRALFLVPDELQLAMTSTRSM